MTQATAAAAIIAAINARFATRRAYELTDPAVPSLTVDHILVTVSRRYVAERRASGEVTSPGGRTQTRYVAKTTGNLYALRAKVTEALEAQILAGDVGPFSFEAEDAPAMDDGWLTAADDWTF